MQLYSELSLPISDKVIIGHRVRHVKNGASQGRISYGTRQRRREFLVQEMVIVAYIIYKIYKY